MSNRTHLTSSPLGALIGLASGIPYYWAYTHWNAWGDAVVTAVMLLQFTLMYIFASKTQRTVLGEWFRGALVGVNAALNGVFVYMLTESLTLTAILTALVFASSFLIISRSRIYHTVLGWFNWFLPMSWAVNLPGLLMFVVNLFFAPIGYIHPLFRAMRVRLYIDVPSGTFTMYGGLLRPFKGFSGMNMGNFIFINPGWEHLLRHEIGHLFSVAAMGAPFHYIGGIDEGYFQHNYWEAYAEYFAESYNAPNRSVMSMWS
ncbi:hypothetical protein [Pontibacter sp. G13]|uniref:hypothetical protein n=1 Tax=Pontibacter sp. G13 TaxID=3074898 RepID=UPI00288B2936|nr:hypothetical protein [Pontibacter sp. G13]WNJ17403.1 hypothetical protein RJD25_21350 [Pontibacter sp. G13]